MTLAALKIGFGVPDHSFAGAVHSVFRRACILRLDAGPLVTLVPEAAGGMPGAITIALPAAFDFTEALSGGAAAASRGGLLRIAGTGFVVDLRPALGWRSDLASLALDPAAAPVQSAWRAAACVRSRRSR